MCPGQAHFVTACQQVLVLGAVLAALAPAASVISLNVIVGPRPQESLAVTPGGLRPASARVPVAVVDPVVHEYPLTPAVGAGPGAGVLQARTKAGPEAGSTQVVSRPQTVTGFGAVGLTWDRAEQLRDDRASFQVRTRTGGSWSAWTDLAYDRDHGPDPGSPEARHSRPGTDPLLVGEVDQVQVRARTTDALPADMRLAVIDPGTANRTRLERPAIDTALLPSPQTPGVPEDTSTKQTSGELSADPSLALRATAFTPKPRIFSRAQWGANESLREKSSLHYFEVHAGFVHHTVNANDYTRAEVPALLRGIYAYHTQSRGWSDIGYNFLVDRFGRIWEGRYGGVDRPVVGAHTLGYNDYSFAMSAIGNFETAQPSDAVLRAYGKLFAWKLSLHGVAADSRRQIVGGDAFRAINGHRDAAATACPGKNLYSRLDQIRAYARADQVGWAGRERVTTLDRGARPDLVVRRGSDGRVFVIPTGGLTGFAEPRDRGTGLTGSSVVVASPDLTGDGEGDLLVRRDDGTTRVRPGNGTSRFGAAIAPTDLFRDHDQLSAVGDLNEDGHHDLIGRHAETGRLSAFLGDGHGSFTRRSLGGDWSAYRHIAGAGDVDGDGHVDIVAVDAAGKGWLRRGQGTLDGGPAVPVTGDFSGVDALTGFGDYNRDGRDDLFVRSEVSGVGAVLPSRGGTGYGHRLGRVVRVKGLAGVSGADLTGSEAPDLVGLRGGTVVLLRNLGTFDTGVPLDTGMALPHADALLNVGDWDRDGFGDVIARNATTGALSLRQGKGNGRFGGPVKVGAGFGRVRLLAAVGDMTGDGYPDLMGQPVGGSMRIYPGAGLNGLAPSYPAYGAIDAGRQIGVGRWNGDGSPDSLLRRGATLRVYPGNGPGGLVSSVTTLRVTLTPYDWVLGLGDVNGDGHGDLVARERATGYLWLLPGRASGLAARRFLGEGLGRYDLAG